MKKIISIVLACALLLSACSSPIQSNISEETATFEQQETVAEQVAESIETDVVETKKNEETVSNNTNVMDIVVKGLDDEALLSYVEDNVYSDLVSQLDSEDYFVENVEAIYYPKEYIKALASNSRANIYFGYTANELDAQFQGTKYVFTLGEDGQTVVVPMETLTDDVYVKAMEDVLIGSGVILVCVTVSVISTPAAPAVSMIFAASATTGTTFALESGGISFVAAAITKGYETESFEQAIKAGISASGEGFKWGAITGAAFGGAKEAIALKGATLNGLTMNEAALIQKESRWPLEAIKSLHSTAEYQIYRKAGSVPTQMSDGSWALLQKIDWKAVDSSGKTNIERVLDGYAPVDSIGESYELHHIGMKADSPLAILTKAEHHSKENYSTLHWAEEGKNVADEVWDKQRKAFWKEVLNRAIDVGIY